MLNKKIKLCAILLFGLGFTELNAQEAIPASGGIATGSGGTASYSIGQAVYSTSTGSNGSVAQGVQQPYEISVLTGLEEVIGINLNLSAYPNPTSGLLILKVDNSDISNNTQLPSHNIRSMSYQLFDIRGKLLETKKLTSNETNIDLTDLVPAAYFLKIIHTQGIAPQQELKTFKIVKNQSK